MFQFMFLNTSTFGSTFYTHTPQHMTTSTTLTKICPGYRKNDTLYPTEELTATDKHHSTPRQCIHTCWIDSQPFRRTSETLLRLTNVKYWSR